MPFVIAVYISYVSCTNLIWHTKVIKWCSTKAKNCGSLQLCLSFQDRGWDLPIWNTRRGKHYCWRTVWDETPEWRRNIFIPVIAMWYFKNVSSWAVGSSTSCKTELSFAINKIYRKSPRWEICSYWTSPKNPTSDFLQLRESKQRCFVFYFGFN